jgi:hypothetical protein
MFALQNFWTAHVRVGSCVDGAPASSAEFRVVLLRSEAYADRRTMPNGSGARVCCRSAATRCANITRVPFGIVGLLQRLEESEQSVIRLEARLLGLDVRLELRQCRFFECKVSVQIGLRGLYRLMAEPQGNYG